jgi:hypothetical protein
MMICFSYDDLFLHDSEDNYIILEYNYVFYMIICFSYDDYYVFHNDDYVF